MTISIRVGRFVAAAVFLIALASCGGGGGGGVGSDSGLPGIAADSTSINGITVPVDPGPAAKASILGVDANGNGVRDEIERSLALYSNGAKSEFDAALRNASAAQKWLTQGVLTEQAAQQLVLQEISFAQCLLASTTPERAAAISQLISLTTFNTAARRVTRQKILDQAGAFELPPLGVASC